MAGAMARAVGAGVSVVVAAACGVATNLATDRAAVSWWIALGVLVVLGALVQVWLSLHDDGNGSSASGAASVAVGRDNRAVITTRAPGNAHAGAAGSGASGAGSVVVGRDNDGDISTDAT